VSFLISGEFITKHARDRVFEYGPDDAVRFLNTAIDGFGFDNAVAVLSGRRKIVGDSREGVDLEDEEPAALAEMQRRLDWKFLGVWYDRSSRKCWRPYARVTGWGEEDMARQRVPNRYNPRPQKTMLIHAAGGDPEAWGFHRCVYYMDDPVEDRVLLLAVPVEGGRLESQMVLWHPVPEIPAWLPLQTSAQKALDAWVEANGIPPERGANIEYARSKRTQELFEAASKVRDETPATKAPSCLDAWPPAPTESEAAPPASSIGFLRSLIPEGTPKFVADGIMRSHEDAATGDAPAPVRATNVRDVEYAWVARDGAVWPCRGYMDHIATAAALALMLKLDLSKWGGNAERCLEATGWVKIGRDAGHKLVAHGDPERHPSDSQASVVMDWLLAKGAEQDELRAWTVLFAEPSIE
jgi:hypothetical protein